MDAKGLLDPCMKAPFNNVSCEDLCDCLDDMRSSEWARMSWGRKHPCTLKEDLNAWVSTIAREYGNLGFESLQDLSD